MKIWSLFWVIILSISTITKAEEASDKATELMKMGHVHAEQEDLFDDIHVEVITDPDTWKNLTEFADE